MAAMNPLINALDRLVPAKSRRLQAVKDKDFIGFDIASCTSKLSNSSENQVIKFVECRNLVLWFVNNLLMNGKHDLHVNPRVVAITDRYIDAVGTDEAKDMYQKMKAKSDNSSRRLQAKKPVPAPVPANWRFGLNSDTEYFKSSTLITDHIPGNILTLQ